MTTPKPAIVPKSLNPTVLRNPFMMNRFTPESSDIQFQSSDGILFNLHKSLLESHTGAFPGPEVDTCGEIVQLTESGKTLELLFEFVYPKRHPDLDNEDFQTVIELAEAVGKYEVYSAMGACNTRLKSFLPEHALDILAYSLKHDHLKLADDAALLLALKPIVPVLKQLPMPYIIAWAEYHDAWASVFTETIKDIRVAPTCLKGAPVCHCTSVSCTLCRNSQFNWIIDLQASKDSIPQLKRALSQVTGFPYSEDIGMACCIHHSDLPASKPEPKSDLGQFLYENAMVRPPVPPATYRPLCMSITRLAKRLNDRISRVKPFSSYILKKEDSS